MASTSALIAEKQGISRQRPAGNGAGPAGSRFAEARVARLDTHR
ncbi:MAG: hypothetical protein AVDCRST_MAG19-4184 [uncultured Thermomicrobiales bacterium]|uniref:Uncharacterized protein n=1 Tax=uncultured Thermomicrobiales bacterium TaxID=1645740 RepID=A0A6J4VNH8_9BACT|nr:MAG: hypothetical protein AVDCRST_MAG19-4184 [uncultured Thermomicrobiales bacterium]